MELEYGNTEQRRYSLIHPTDKKYFKSVLRTNILNSFFNATPLWLIPLRNLLFRKMVKRIDGKPYSVFSPIYLQFGDNLVIGKNFFSNCNCMILDRGGVKIGDNVLLGPNVMITSVSHPMLAEERMVRKYNNSYEPGKRSDVQKNSPVTIGNGVWIAANAIVCPGVTIGDNSVIGAGSVVTRDIPPDSFACGVPCRVIRKITEKDRILKE